LNNTIEVDLNDDDEVDNMDYDDEDKGPALEIYGTDLTLLALLLKRKEPRKWKF
jgi:hypothetical protein